MSTLVKTRGIVLGHHFYGESSAVVQVYTKALGRQSYIVNSIRGGRKNKKTPLLQPLNRLQMEVYHSPKKELHHIKEYVLEYPLKYIPYSQSTRAQAFFITEVLTKVLHIQEPAAQTYDFINSAIDLMDAPHRGSENFHLYFLFRLTRLMGFQPMDNYSSSEPWFDLKNGYFSASQPDHACFLAPEAARLFARLFRSGADAIHELARSTKERTMLLESILNFYRLHTQGLGELKSLEVLHHTLHPTGENKPENVNSNHAES